MDQPSHPQEDDSFSESVDLSNSESSYSLLQHPNEEQRKSAARHMHVYKGCAKYLHRFDELIMRPIFIYRYEKNMQKKSKEFFDIFMKYGDEIEQDFNQEKCPIQKRKSIRASREAALRMVQFEEPHSQLNSQGEASAGPGGSIGKL